MDRDVFLFNAGLSRGLDLDFIEFVAEKRSSEHLTLVLVTNGGDPNAAYKIGRYLQSQYETVETLVSGLCKSAGTLLAIAASEVVFSPYGELGPLDVQLTKADNMAGPESGLNISEAFTALELRARSTFHDLVSEILHNSGGIVSFPTASHSAAEIVSGLYGPIFSRFDPEEVGSRARAMRIGGDYGSRLNLRFENLVEGALHKLSRTYSSHGFVIDLVEAKHLFKNVREVNWAEKKLVEELGACARFPTSKPLKIDVTGRFKAVREATDENHVTVSDRNGKRNGRTPDDDGGDSASAS